MQQRRRSHVSQRPTRQIRAAAARHDGGNLSGRSAAAISAAPPPVLAPNKPIGSAAVSSRPRSQSTIATSRDGEHRDVEPVLRRPFVDPVLFAASADR